MKHHFQRSFSASQYYYHLFQVRILILGRTNTLSVIPQLNVKAEILEPKPFWPQSLRSAKTQKRLLPRGMISRTRNAPYLRKHQDFAARFLHRNTISAMYLKVSATGCWECKLEGKVTWGLVMRSLFRTVSEQGPTSDSFVREEGDARGQRRSHFKRSTPRKEESRSAQNNTSSISPDPSVAKLALATREEERYVPISPWTLWWKPPWTCPYLHCRSQGPTQGAGKAPGARRSVRSQRCGGRAQDLDAAAQGLRHLAGHSVTARLQASGQRGGRGGVNKLGWPLCW